MNFLISLATSVENSAKYATPSSTRSLQQWISIITGPEVRSAFLFSTGLVGVILLAVLLAMLRRKS